MAKKICEQCSKEFGVDPYRADVARFCSQSCCGLWKSENLRRENSPNWKGGKVKLICKQCGKEFEAKPSRSNAKFCSQGCKGLWQSENLHGENSPIWKGRIKKFCEICSEEFGVTPHEAETVRFCSNPCRGLWISENRRGESNHNWKGGLSFEPYGLEFNDKLKQAIRKRDNYTCAISGKAGQCVHHINYDKTDNRPENLITLSVSCHGKTNANRDLWQKRLTNLMKTTYGYSYERTGNA